MCLMFCRVKQSSLEYQLFGIAESRLDFRITYNSISIPDYYIIRRHPQLPRQTGIYVYVHHSVQDITHRRKDLENDEIECIWLELKPHAFGLSLFVSYLYTNPAVTVEWYDSFVQMFDDVYKVKNCAGVLILGHFNIDMLKPHSYWYSNLALFGLAHLITSPTRTTPSSTSLIDHIYTNNPSAVVTTDVSDLSIGDHNPISCTSAIKLPNREPKGHTNVPFRSFKHFNQSAFFADLICTPFDNVH